MVDSKEKTPRFDRKLFETPGNKTAQALLEALLDWGSRYEMPKTSPGTFPYIVRTVESLYRDGAVTLIPMEDEQSEERGPFAIERYTDEESELTCILFYLHPGTIIEAINTASESEKEPVLHAFAKVVLETFELYKELHAKGARFPH
ncbi:hypothetical protein IH981_02485 [Patescibacteria group bacterium]|nr:hypothetical protein [Patescibacteria group bacterium]